MPPDVTIETVGAMRIETTERYAALLDGAAAGPHELAALSVSSSETRLARLAGVLAGERHRRERFAL